MIGELDLNGLFLSPALASAVIAFAIHLAVRRGLAQLRIHRFVWHAALFDGCLFLIIWAAVAACPLLRWS